MVDYENYTPLDAEVEFSVGKLIHSIETYKPPRMVIFEMNSHLKAFTCSSDGSVIFVGNTQGEIYKYERNFNKTSMLSTDSESIITDLVLIDDSTLISACTKGWVQAWDTEELSLLMVLEESPDCVSCLCLTGDKKILVAGGSNICMWTLPALEKFSEIPFPSLVSSMVISPDGNYLIIGDEDQGLVKMNFHDRSIVSTAFSNQGEIMGIQVSQNSDKVYTLGDDGTFMVWDFENLKKSRILGWHDSAGMFLDISSDGVWAVTTSEDKTLKLWSLEYEREEMSLSFDATIEFCKFGPQDKEIICCKNNGEMEIVSLEIEGYELNSIQTHTNWLENIIVSSDNRYIFTASKDGFVNMYEYGSFRPVLQLQHENQVNSISLSHNTNLLITSVTTRDETSVIYFRQVGKEEIIDILSDIQSYERNLCVSEDDKYLFTKSDTYILIYDLLTRRLIDKIYTGNTLIGAMILNPCTDTILVSNNLFNIQLWNYKTHCLITTFKRHTDYINCLIIQQEANVLISGGNDRMLNFWSLSYNSLIHSAEMPYKIKDVEISEDERFLIICTYSKVLYIYSIEEKDIIQKIDFKGVQVFNTMTMCKLKEYVLLGSNKEIYYLKNPLHSEQLSVNRKKYSVLYINYLKNIASKPMYNQYFNRYRILPWNINTLHVLASSSNIKDTKQILRDGIQFIKSLDGKTPIDLSLERNNKHCADAIIKRLSKYNISEHKNLCKLLEDSFTGITEANLPSLSRFFNIMFSRVQDTSLNSYGCPNGEMPIVKLSSCPHIKQDEFILRSTTKPNTDETALIYKQSALRLDLHLGSTESMRFIKSLRESEDPEVFRTPLIQSILHLKWHQVRLILVIQALIYIIYTTFLILQVWNILPPLVFIIIFSLLNIYFTITEILQAFSEIKDYLQEIWNSIDLLRILLTYIYILTQILEYKSTSLFVHILQSLIIFLCWVRLIAYFRMFKRTRYLIRVIIEVVMDMIPFVMIFVTGTVAISLIFLSVSDDSDFADSFTHTYRLNYGDFDTDAYGDNMMEWAVFVLASFINPLVMMNLLIAIMGDTYSRVQDNEIVADGREICYMVLEAESVLFWKRGSGIKMYLQQCSSVEDCMGNNDQMQGRIREIKNSIKQLIIQNKEEERVLQQFRIRHDKDFDSLRKRTKDMNLVVQSIRTEMTTMQKDIKSIKNELMSLPGRLHEVINSRQLRNSYPLSL